jgi:PKD repeat protein
MGGYFWISYHDKWCCKHPEMGAVSLHDVRLSTYTDVYCHDYHGWRDTRLDCQRVVNAFAARSGDAVGTVNFYTAADNIGYTVTIYDRFDLGGPVDLLATASGVVEHTGFHTVDLDQIVCFVPGDSFYVELILTDGGQAFDRTSEVPVLLAADPEAPDVIVPSSSAPGQSYYYASGTWHDLYEDDSTANFCVKAVADGQHPIVPSQKFGRAPLETTLSVSRPTTEILNCHWTFDDGSTSDDRQPTHVFAERGVHTIQLEAETAGGSFSCLDRCAVLVYADTVLFADGAIGLDAKVTVDLIVSNGIPLSTITLPFGWDGPFDLVLDSVSFTGCRTESLASAAILSLVPQLKRATLLFQSGPYRYLEPGRGVAARLYFTAGVSPPSEINPIGIAEYSEYELSFTTFGQSYDPETVDGAIVVNCCEGRVGDVDSLGGDEPTIGDVAALIDMLYISFADVLCLAEADVNQSGGLAPQREDITVGDISYLIDYLFITGPSIGLPDCP